MSLRLRTLSCLVAGALLTAASLAGAAERGQLLAAGNADLVPRALSSAVPAVVVELEAQPVDFAWAIPADSELRAPAPFVAESREFWSLQPADQLRRGVGFELASAGALVRISPAGGNDAAAVELDALVVTLDGRALAEGRGILRSASAEQLRTLGADFGNGSRVLQLDPAVGNGRLELRIPGASGAHLVHVFEPNSDEVLSLSTDRDIVVAGGRLGISAHWSNGDATRNADVVSGVITAPDGRSFDLQFRRDRAGSYRAELDLPASVAALPGLWEVHGFAAARVQGRQLLRDARTSFAVSVPSARLGGGFGAELGSDGLRISIDVSTAAAGRYELRGTLYGTASDGRQVPFAVAHAARRLEAGDGEITLTIDRALIDDAKVGAPFEVRDLSLNDQGRMSRQESRALALRVEAPQAASPAPRGDR
jgi:hypothetical protein